MRTRLLILDCQDLTRIGLRKVLSQLSWLEVVGEAKTLAVSLPLVRQRKPDLILMGSRFSDGTGLGFCHQLREQYSNLPIVYLTSSNEENSLKEVFEAGASSILLPSVGPEHLIQTLELCVLGYNIYPDSLSRTLRGKKLRLDSEHGGRLSSLSPNEHKLLGMVAQGKTNKEIAAVCGVSEKTIKKTLSQLFNKLHVTRRTQAVALLTKHSI